MNEQDAPKITPMLRQYQSIKETCSDALLFYRMGDFYELFFDDAAVAAKELQLVLTARSRNTENAVPMCGVPWHSAVSYITKLVDRGYKVALCDQIEDPRDAKGIVKRAVTRVFTSGTIIDEAGLKTSEHNFIGAILWDERQSRGGFAWADISTGFWTGISLDSLEELWSWVQKTDPRELLITDRLSVPQYVRNAERRIVPLNEKVYFRSQSGISLLLKTQEIPDLQAIGLHKLPELTGACTALLQYIRDSQPGYDYRPAPFEVLNIGDFLIVDDVTERNLELFRTLDGRRGKGTLFNVLDKTCTPMGGRLLEERLHRPWRRKEPAEASLNAVAFLVQEREFRRRLRDALEKVYDLERLTTRITLNRTSPKDMASLAASLNALPAVSELLLSRPDLPPAMDSLCRNWDPLSDLRELLSNAIVEDPPQLLTEGGIFKTGYNDRLDELLDLTANGEKKLQKLLEKEQTAANIPKMKLGFNRVFGYYFEISRSALTDIVIPDHFHRRQTLANAERFTTPQLQELENALLSASEKQKELEYRLFQDLRAAVSQAGSRLLLTAGMIANLDVWQSFALSAEENRWSRPELFEDRRIDILEGRHPVVEAMLGTADFVPNDLHMDAERRLLLITGPNMAGKSTVLRQTALICLMAQAGSFVPAREARIGLCDRLFSRVGASDNLAKGQSTFMVEMMETARILRQATSRSLVILDEIGRGTSTFDGLSIAWAVAEALAHKAGRTIRTLFATHYHELTELDGLIPGIRTMSIAVKEWNGSIVFLRRLIPGPANRSYGIEVAKLAGMPRSVVKRAGEILTRLEGQKPERTPVQAVLPDLFPEQSADQKSPARSAASLLTELKTLKTETMTPEEALTIIKKWKTQWSRL
ncbi:MAG: DNA mismatch repair protein MutS [Desulfovibrionaceae bacterium]|nr:DNA mismatch repair protein MutS [Desulfovibrionaceae bacterium]